MSLKRTGGMFLALLLLVSTPVTLTMAHGAQSSGKGSYSGKSEVVYATLEADGDQKEIYVVNKFSVDRPGKIIDYGPYTRVENLTDLTEMEVDGQRVGFVTSKDLFYYQGTLKDRPLPWDIDVSYRLNGKNLPPEQLLGKDGKLEIRIHTRANEKAGENPFFENYMLQISLTLDPEIYENVEAKDGTIAEAGKNQQVTFTVMPGKEASFVVRAEVRDLEMESIQITGIPPGLSVDIPDADGMMDGMRSLSDAVQGIDAGISELNKGMAELHQGVEGLYGGSKKYKQGIRELEQGSAELIEGSKSIRDALKKLSRSLGGDADQIDVGQLKELQKRLADMAGGLKQTENSLTALQDQYTKAYHALDRSIAAIPAQDISEEDIRQLKASGADPRVVDQLVQTYTAARAAKDAYTAVKGSFQAVNPTLKEVARSVREMSIYIEIIADRLDNSLNQTHLDESMKKLQQGLQSLSEQYGAFHSGLVDYTRGVARLSQNYGRLHTGIAEMKDGTRQFQTGMHELHQGTSKLARSTRNLPDQMQSEIDQMVSEYDRSDFDPVSFVSSKNKKVKSVQFVLKTESIKKEEDKPKSGPKEEENKGFWSRLLDLFKS
ncbi:putative phage infection (PIP) family protein YhgE [Planifilum fimeticola]|uniref:Putative phage infection (PIP) family protein YhgE n=1 Tax=Planifilum fimeticola TaxID=201975 RepID=A0A2T0LBM4_9BACL|nr:hypothetical protein [Planifilum fimeticola]PRX39084.1 putative phage infection (PIP) family protein YhgE [Planifilum fimeticola]